MFDIQYLINTIYVWKSIACGLEEIKRCGKENSYVLLVFYQTNKVDEIVTVSRDLFHLDQIESVTNVMKEKGMTDIQVHHFLGNIATGVIAKIHKEENV